MHASRRSSTLPFTVIAAATLLLAACGPAASVAPTTAAADYNVEVEMLDIAFAPTELTVHVGDTVHFVFTNTGHLDHEAVIGDQVMQDAHEAENVDGAHPSHAADATAEPHEVEVAVAKTGTLDYTFTTAGTVIMGCHEPAHIAAGMTLAITVEP
ncbi:MAG: plastocyanin/azurin family copper-binding protein [Gemmatimonadales bacterium]